MSVSRKSWFANRSKDSYEGSGVAVLDRPDAGALRGSLPSSVERLDKESWIDLDPRPVLAVDREHRVVYINPATEILVGRRLSDVVGLPSWELLDSPACREKRCSAWDAIRQGRLAEAETTFAIGDRNISFHAYAEPRLDGQGNVIGALLWLSDISESVNLSTQLARLVECAREGRLDERGDTSSLTGRNQEMLREVNEMLDAIIRPLNLSSEYIEHISAGDIPAKITADYRGDFNKIKNNLNSCIDSMNALVFDIGFLAAAGVEGRLATRADAAKHKGDYRKIVDGINHTLDSVVGPIQEVAKVIGQMANGDLTGQIESSYSGDFDQLKHAVNQLSNQFGMAIQEIGKEATSLVVSSAQLNQLSHQMGASAEETSTQANVVSAAAEQVSRNVQTVATGADEMGASIKEIAKSTAEATRVANAAVKTAGITNQTIAKLGQSSAEIGQVIKVITSIAQQTNLLALNATIEAARAGEAGKGFAVVANEVKELAKETAKATEDISQKIEAIQGDTKGAVSAIGEISEIIAQISDIQNTIASAIEEQSCTTNEIIRNLAEAAKGSSEISGNIGGVAEAAQTTSAGAAETQQSAKSLEKMAAGLQGMVSQFRT